MKTKIVLPIFLMFFIATVNERIFARGFYNENIDSFCKYQALLHNLNRANEEFEMLLEPTYHPNFRGMLQVLDNINIAYESEEHLDILLHHPDCNISKYTKNLLTFYKANKEKITENVKRKVPRELQLGKDDLKILSTFDQLAEKINKKIPIEKDEL